MHLVYNWTLRRSGRGIRVFGDILWDGEDKARASKLPTVDMITLNEAGVMVCVLDDQPIAMLRPHRTVQRTVQPVAKD